MPPASKRTKMLRELQKKALAARLAGMLCDVIDVETYLLICYILKSLPYQKAKNVSNEMDVDEEEEEQEEEVEENDDGESPPSAAVTNTEGIISVF